MNIKIVSGGQTGADQGGLFGAKDAGVGTGGYAPSGFLTETGPQPMLLRDFFGLVDSGLGYSERTLLNVERSDITIWFGDAGSPGGKTTRKAAKNSGKIFTDVTTWPADQVARLIQPYAVINVAGNRESRNPGIFETTRTTVREALLLLQRISR